MRLQRQVARPQSDEWSRRPSRRQLAVFGGYAAAAAVYVVIGVFFTDFLLSVLVAFGYLLLVAWLVPTAVRRLL
jgi:hypothetical protein